MTGGEVESDTFLKSLLINDASSNPAYQIDFAKFLATIVGSGGSNTSNQIGQGNTVVSGGTGAATTAGYY